MVDEKETVLDKLKVALGLVETLKQENDAYRDNFEQLKNGNEQLQEQYENLERECEISVKEKAALDAQMNETTTYLKTQVEEKTKELNDIRSKALKPKDLDIIKFRTIQDMEEQNEKRWKGLQKEMEKFRSAYYALRRDHEVAKADIDRERATMEAKAREMEAVYQEETAALEARTLELRQCLDTSTDIKRHREIQRELADLQIKMQTMQPEIDELRAEREKLRVDIEQQARVHQRKLMDEVSHSKLLQAEKESLLSRITSLETEDTQNLRKLDQMSEQNTILTKELDKTKSRLEEATHKFNTAMSDQKLEGLKYKNEYENIISDLKDKKAEIESRLKQAEEVIGNLRERVAHGEKDLLEKLRIAREEEWAKRAQIESEKCELEKQLAASKQKVTEDETWNDTARKELQNELAQLKQTVRILQTQKDGLAQKEQENTIMIDRMNVDLTQLRSSLLEAESIGKDAMKDVELHKKAEEVLRDKLSTLEVTLSNVQAKLTDLTEQSEKEREAYIHNAERHRGIWAKEKLSLHQQVEALDNEKDDLLSRLQDLEKLMAKSQSVFKCKAQTWKLKTKTYKEEIQRLRSAAEAETRRVEAINKELHQRQVDFMGLLRTEGILEASA